MTASPIAPPACCPMSTRPDATPVSSLRTLVSPTSRVSTTFGPRPAARTSSGPSMPSANVLCSVIRDSQTIPPTATAPPAISSGRAPTRVTACCVTTVAARITPTNGR